MCSCEMVNFVGSPQRTTHTHGISAISTRQNRNKRRRKNDSTETLASSRPKFSDITPKCLLGSNFDNAGSYFLGFLSDFFIYASPSSASSRSRAALGLYFWI